MLRGLVWKSVIKTKGPALAAQFLSQYDAPAKDAIWKNHQNTFRKFWESRIRAQDTPELSDDECDEIIRILDRHGRGNTRTSEAAAAVMVAQGTWRKLFRRLRQRDLGDLVDAIFRSSNPEETARLIDNLYAKNTERNYLTGPSANIINALTFAYDPFSHISIVSIRDREALVHALGRALPADLSIGNRIVRSEEIICEELAAIGLKGSTRTLSSFCYWEPMCELWKGVDTAKTSEKIAEVSIPVARVEEEPESSDDSEIRESMQIQASLAELGVSMGFKIWIPKPDRGRVLKVWKPDEGALLEELPLNYEMRTLKTIEAIDVLWVRNRSIVRAFEVEHTTSVYSGILRMADLLALQPNMSINLHLVAPASKRDKVFREMRRPVFSSLEGCPLEKVCTFLSYDSVKKIRNLPHSKHLTDSVIEDFEELAQESE